MNAFDFIPADTLFFRDQRPLEAGSSFGHGANWPLPTVLHSAIRTALLRADGGLPPRNGVNGRPHKGRPRTVASTKFQWLNLRGPFPVECKDGKETMYFPIPRDLVPAGDSKVAYLQIIKNRGINNLPAPLTHLAAPPGTPSKNKLPEWISFDEYQSYLAGTLTHLAEHAPLWETEHRIGVAIDPATHAAKEGQLYAAEHLRLRDDVKLRFVISEDPHQKESADLASKILQLGGEQRFGKVTPATGAWSLPSAPITGRLVKWVLLTPAIFIHGWRPGWVDENTGEVKLRVVDKTKRADRRRPRYNDPNWTYDPQRDEAEPMSARLVAAVVGKPQVVGGWDDAPKPTSLAVPSGSVYYFEAADDKEAGKLVAVLQERCKSDFFGEKGLGLGVCGTWQFYGPDTSDQSDQRKETTA